VELANGGMLGAFAAAIIAGCGADAGVAHELLDGRDVSAGVEQVAGEGAAQVMWTEDVDAGLVGSFLEDLVDGGFADTPWLNFSAFENNGRSSAS
jgi:hypothetical protein